MIAFQRTGRTLFVTFQKPETLNALDAAMALDLDKLTHMLLTDRDLGLVVLQGAGRAFMAGGDINGFRGDPATVKASIGAIMSSLNAFIAAVAEAQCLVIASVHGAVAGGGLSIMLACDIAIAAASTRFVFAYAQLGTTPDGGLTTALPAIVGRQRATALLLASDPITADKAASLGIIAEAVPDAEREARTLELARRLEANSALANAQTKALLRAASLAALREQLAAEAQAFQTCADGSDFKEGVTAFLEKRPPAFGGAPLSH